MYPGDQTYVYSIRPNNLEGTVVAPNNYWGSDNPDFSALIDKSRAPNGSVDYFPYYSDVALGTLIYKMVTISEDTVWATPHPNQKVTVLDGATLTLSVPMSLDTVTMREGAQIKSNLADQTGSVTTKSLRFSPDLSGTEWKFRSTFVCYGMEGVWNAIYLCRDQELYGGGDLGSKCSKC